MEKSADFTKRWRRVAAAGALYYTAENISDAQLSALFAPPAALKISSLGRGGGHFTQAELGPLRLKIYQRGGLFGKLFPQCGLDEAATTRELAAEWALSGAGLATQETLAMCIQRDAPRLRAIQRYFPDEMTHAELAARKTLTEAQRQGADELLQKIVAAGYLHRDSNGGNLLWNESGYGWRIIDLASARPLGSMNPTRALAMMRARLAKPPRAYRNAWR